MAKKHTVIIDDINDGESKELIEKVKTRFDAANQKTFDLYRRFYRGRIRRKSCPAYDLSPKRAQSGGTSKTARICA
ncbi:MAG: hypothetical protein SPL22_08405 [Treponema sp.]|uniref:hypothetical protein n=1 Tax=Treponema sp. TaxID=166 RepID=UPI002A9134D2|nr:hypothetical protein [Treponema sp.]MDY6397740.1 hypothetical protein [Treponema sp.]